MMSESLETGNAVETEKLTGPGDDIKQNGDSDTKPEPLKDCGETDKDCVDVKPVSPPPVPEPAPEEPMEIPVKESHNDVEKPAVKENVSSPSGNSENAASQDKEELTQENEEPVEEKKDEEKDDKKDDKKEVADSEDQKEERPVEESNDIESESDEEKVGILEVDPVIQDGVKRARKKVERLSDVIDKTLAEKEDKNKSKDKFPEGKGVPLGEIEFIKTKLNKTNVNELKLLHLTVMNRVGTQREIKSVLRRFRGFEFSAESAEYKNKLSRLNSRKVQDIRGMLKILGLDHRGQRDEMAQRLLDFLMKPDASCLVPVRPKKKPTTKSNASSKTPKVKPKKKTTDDVSDDSDEEAKSPKKTPRSKGSKGSQSKAAPKKKKAAVKRKAEDSDQDDGSDDSNDRESDSDSGPATKKTKKMPTDEELKKTILGLLENVDLEKVTMKNVLHQIYEKYEGLDLTHKKEYLKSVVKDILSN